MLIKMPLFKLAFFVLDKLVALINIQSYGISRFHKQKEIRPEVAS
jgi:hypothetical protein